LTENNYQTHGPTENIGGKSRYILLILVDQNISAGENKFGHI
jgi:hypothetical protein